MTQAIDGLRADGTPSAYITDCRFSRLVTKGVDGFGANEAELSENYLGYNTARDNIEATLISVIT